MTISRRSALSAGAIGLAAAGMPVVAAENSSRGPTPHDTQRLVDRAEISDLILSFANAVDTRNHAEYAGNFTEDGILELPFGRWQGRATILAMEQPKPKTASHHVLTNHMVRFTSKTTATGRAYLVATHVFNTDNRRDIAQAGGWYDYEFRKTADGWRFAKVALTVVWESADMLRE